MFVKGPYRDLVILTVLELHKDIFVAFKSLPIVPAVKL